MRLTVDADGGRLMGEWMLGEGMEGKDVLDVVS